MEVKIQNGVNRDSNKSSYRKGGIDYEKRIYNYVL